MSIKSEIIRAYEEMRRRRLKVDTSWESVEQQALKLASENSESVLRAAAAMRGAYERRLRGES